MIFSNPEFFKLNLNPFSFWCPYFVSLTCALGNRLFGYLKNKTLRTWFLNKDFCVLEIRDIRFFTKLNFP